MALWIILLQIIICNKMIHSAITIIVKWQIYYLLVLRA